MTDETAGSPGGDPVDPLEGPTTPRPGSTDPDNEVVPADQAEPVAAAPDPDAGSGAPAPSGPTSAGERIRRSAERLDELASELRDPDVSDSRAAELAREAAELVGSAASEVDRALRAAGETD
ncbi:hypothetical protein HJD18_08600 [Thermoleophilia bacterium SCSIO 60948]|nr:hypothetical protein HJD18_08600 [Thermoleophilia bacterium SCSIO 60948]